MSERTRIDKSLFQFLVELKFNNERAFFTENKARYEKEVKLPFRAAVERLAEKIGEFHPGGLESKIFRIYRDTRFSKDKTPYKTNVAAHFGRPQDGGNVHLPAFYLHLEPGESFAGGGLWMPEPSDLKAVRDRIAAADSDWKKLKAEGVELWRSDELKRVPKGYPSDHPDADDLKRRHFFRLRSLADAEIFSPRFEEKVLAAFQAAAPLVTFLEKTILEARARELSGKKSTPSSKKK
jgi:uncharacterized protein (TIGR02453 family)